MKVRSIVLGIFLMMNLLSFSQTDTSKICLPKQIAKLIAIDLIKGDSAKAELELTQILVTQQQSIISEKDSLLSISNKKIDNYQTQLETCSSRDKIYQNDISSLKNDNSILIKKIKRKTITNKILGFISLLIGGAFILK